MNTTTKTPPVLQTFEHFSVRIIRSKDGSQRAAEITPFGRAALRYFVPVEMLSLAAGKDAWMRDIKFKCSDCGEKHAAKEMECQLCPACYEKAEQENAQDKETTLPV